MSKPIHFEVTTESEPSDASLVMRCRAGEQAAWGLVVRRFQRLVYTVPRRAGLSEADAADVFQLCFSRLFQHLKRLDDPSRVRAWLVTTAKRETLRLLEQHRRVAPLPADPGLGNDSEVDPLDAFPDPSPLPEAQLAELQEQDRVRRAVERLDARSRDFVELLFLRDPTPSYTEIAARLGIAEGSIGPTRARCLAKLRSLLGEV